MTMARTQSRESSVLKVAFEVVAGKACNVRRLDSANRLKAKGEDRIQKEDKKVFFKRGRLCFIS